jgi:uncharacterized membrane protein YvbJ
MWLKTFLSLNEKVIFDMSIKFCTHCGKNFDSKDKFCIFCGKSSDEDISEIYEPVERKPNTFFCPSCKHENIVDNSQCINCREDFSEYSIRRSFSETSVSRKAKSRDQYEREYIGRTSVDDKPTRRFPYYIVITITVLISGVAIWFLWCLISCLNSA